VALSQHVDASSGGTKAFAKVITEMLFQFALSPVPLTPPACNMAWNFVALIGLLIGTR
jgi:hypothetical protein